MIRRFFMLIVFVTTVGMAAFGQHIFGRADLIRIGHRVQAEAPAKTEQVLKKTDLILASLAPSAGTEEDSTCSYDDLSWAIHFHQANIHS